MKAAICTKYGSPEVITIQEVSKPISAKHQILVKVMATAVNSGDVRTRSLDAKGILKFLMRIVLGWSKPRKSILGTVFSGVVESIGSHVTKFKAGDKVFGMTGFQFGTHAEYIVVNEKSHTLPIPINAGFEEAAAIIFGGQTAIYYLHKAKINQKQQPKMMILGATGSVGVAAVQIAQYYKAKVTAVCSSEGKELIKDLAADSILLYDKVDIAQCTEKFDIVFDAIGKYHKKQYKRLLNENGAHISVSSGYASESLEQLQLLKKLFELGHLKAVIDKTFSLDQIREAHGYVDTGHKKGNVVIKFN
ncbi:MAG: NAD(P)-dependent alcohol dehydrogenase [Cyclobacteriaceae bacterium]|nr:NAD(P)-dependent alcohol dehydrogenase [Cyclobacteriaceae bacterium]UYN87906.1 MAG: NAD(P)-dependent alcohol dehydrogenase [Cyclobacteriaceae bacterium]